jgi:gas vesicle protein
MSEKRSGGLDDGALFWGFLIGLLMGAAAALFRVPRSGDAMRQQINDLGHNLRHKIESAVPTDPIAESISEGKAAARRRRLELGLSE